ncbi:hypothetical protein J4Q44_G00138220 [Coregonus suidteri]|uniref:Uncharacterized protein n=1 Tax=Coregonus suidteri TaxID=861788 RepID=A0AAN8LT11_9TELE
MSTVPEDGINIRITGMDLFDLRGGLIHPQLRIPHRRQPFHGQRLTRTTFATMGCAMCSQLIDMWSVSVRITRRRAMELSALPEVLQGGYHRVTSLHYMSSFSDAEDCCDDNSHNSTTGSSFTMDWQETDD